MSRFPTSEPEHQEPGIVGTIITGAFECDVCYKVTASAIHNRKEERLYWDCPEGHSNSIHFKI